MINWNCSHEEMSVIVTIAERVEADLKDYPDDRCTIIMDLMACHANGCPLQLGELLKADLSDFSHDIYGIRKAIDRTTGQLTEDCFVPRYAVQ